MYGLHVEYNLNNYFGFDNLIISSENIDTPDMRNCHRGSGCGKLYNQSANLVMCLT